MRTCSLLFAVEIGCVIPSLMIPADAPASSEVRAARSKITPSLEAEAEEEGAGGMASETVVAVLSS